MRVAIIIISLVTAIFFTSVGYGSWDEKLIIKGTIKVVEPEKVLEPAAVAGPQPGDSKSVGGLEPVLGIESSGAPINNSILEEVY